MLYTLIKHAAQGPFYIIISIGNVYFVSELYIRPLQCFLLKGNARLKRFPKGSFRQSFWAFKSILQRTARPKHYDEGISKIFDS